MVILRYIILILSNMLISPAFHELDYIPEETVLFRCVLNMLHSYIKIESDNPKKFKFISHKFLYENSF
jgi:hypothetical protein